MLEYVVDYVYAVEIERGEDGKKYRPSGAKNGHMALTAHCNTRARDG